MSRRSRLAPLGALLAAFPWMRAAPAAETSFRSELLLSRDLRWEEGEDGWEGFARWDARARGRGAGGSRWVLGAAGELELEVGEEARAGFGAWPGDCWWQAPRSGGTRLRLGLQRLRWGELDLLSGLDTLSPRDLRHGPLLAPEDARLPAPALYLDAGPSLRRLELVLLPFFAPDRVALLGSDWSPLPRSTLEAALEEAASWGGDPAGAAAGAALAELLESRLEQAGAAGWLAAQDALEELGAPSSPGEGSGAALRLSSAGSRGELALHAAWLRDPRPTLVLSPALARWASEREWPPLDELLAALEEEAPLRLDYPRSLLLGSAGALLLGAQEVRGELAWRSRVDALSPSLELRQAPLLSAGLGASRAWSRLGLEAEARWERWLGPEEALLARERDEWRLALAALGSRGRWRPRLGLLVDPARGEGLARAELGLGLGGGWNLAAGLLLFEGGEVPRSLGELGSYGGGPLGLLGRADAGFLRLDYRRTGREGEARRSPGVSAG